MTGREVLLAMIDAGYCKLVLHEDRLCVVPVRRPSDDFPQLRSIWDEIAVLTSSGVVWWPVDED